MTDRLPIVVITGGARGIGLALARLLARAGLRIVLADVDRAALDRARDGLVSGELIEPYLLDVTDAAAVQTCIAHVLKRHGALDFLFNNAGVGGTLDVRDATLGHWRRIVELNLMGVVHGVQAAYPVMLRQGSGHIVNTASISGLVPWPGQTLYNTTKYAVVGLSHTLRQEAALHGVKVSVVCPGPVDSAIWGAPILGQRVEVAAPKGTISVAAAADAIWRGVQANRATIILPARSRLYARLYHLHPNLLRRQLRSHLHRVMST